MFYFLVFLFSDWPLSGFLWYVVEQLYCYAVYEPLSVTSAKIQLAFVWKLRKRVIKRRIVAWYCKDAYLLDVLFCCETSTQTLTWQTNFSNLSCVECFRRSFSPAKVIVFNHWFAQYVDFILMRERGLFINLPGFEWLGDLQQMLMLNTGTNKSNFLMFLRKKSIAVLSSLRLFHMHVFDRRNLTVNYSKSTCLHHGNTARYLELLTQCMCTSDFLGCGCVYVLQRASCNSFSSCFMRGTVLLLCSQVAVSRHLCRIEIKGLCVLKVGLMHTC